MEEYTWDDIIINPTLEEAKKITKERRPDLWKKFNNE